MGCLVLNNLKFIQTLTTPITFFQNQHYFEGISCIFILAIVLLISILGCRQDKTYKKFSNKYILALILSGTIYAIFTNRIGYALIEFVILNVVGCLMYSLGFWGGADGKFMSIGAFILPLENIFMLVTFLICFIIVMIVMYLIQIKKGEFRNAMRFNKAFFQYMITTKSIMKVEELTSFKNVNTAFTPAILYTICLSFGILMIFGVVL